MSLKKIASIVGVSPSTVSRVLNNTIPSCASPEIKKKIWDTAHALNYVPNKNARNLQKGINELQKNYQIAIILARFNSLDNDPFFRELFQYVEESLFANSCTLHSITSIANTNFSILKNVDGVIIFGRCSHNFINNLKRYTRNIVGIDRNPTDYTIDEIICNGKTAAKKAMDYLIGLGHTEIGYIGDCSSESRYIGYCETLITNNIPLNYNYIRSTNQTYESGQSAMQELISTGISAVLCANDITAIGALNILSTPSCKPQNKISIISIDNIALSLSVSPLLTTVNIPKEDMGHMAVAVLLDRIKHKHNEILRLEFPCKIIERDSCYPHKG